MNSEALKNPLIMPLFGLHLNKVRTSARIFMLPNYLCPLCKLPLLLENTTYRCSANHCFDQAREGYVNLLPVQHKHSKAPGDNKQMVQARRAFLEKEFYTPLIAHIKALYLKYGDNGKLLDAGCGEGYYTHQHKTETNTVYGVDIAKEAIKIAAKKYKQCHFSVGTLSLLPFEDNYFDWVYSIYAPILEAEFTRALCNKGYLLTVTPAENHLKELKRLIYREANIHDTQKRPIKDLTLIVEEKLNYNINFTDQNDVMNLLSMTPFAFKASDALIEKIKTMDSFNCQADFMIRLYQKQS